MRDRPAMPRHRVEGRIRVSSPERGGMLIRIVDRARHNAVAYVALFVALGGTAFAATSLKPNSVGTAQLKNRAVTGAKVALHTLTGANINASTLGIVPEAARLDGLGPLAFERAITGKCSGFQAIQTITREGKIGCHSFGAITGITAGTGLTGGGTSGNVILAVDPTVVQARVTGSCTGRGAVSSINQDGTINCHSTDEVQMMGGTGTTPLNATSDYLVPMGIGAPSAQEQAVELGSANAPSDARHLFVRVATAPGSGGTWTFDFAINGRQQKAMSCVISGSAKSCHSTGSVSIPRGARVAIHESGSKVTAATTATYGWTDNTF